MKGLTAKIGGVKCIHLCLGMETEDNTLVAAEGGLSALAHHILQFISVPGKYIPYYTQSPN